MVRDYTNVNNNNGTLTLYSWHSYHAVQIFWEKFENQLTHAFTVYAKDEGQSVHFPSMKLRILLNKVKADFLAFGSRYQHWTNENSNDYVL